MLQLRHERSQDDDSHRKEEHGEAFPRLVPELFPEDLAAEIVGSVRRWRRRMASRMQGTSNPPPTTSQAARDRRPLSHSLYTLRQNETGIGQSLTRSMKIASRSCLSAAIP